MDVLAVRDAVAEAVARARAGGGPSLVVATSYRFEGHFVGDPKRYRSADEAKPGASATRSPRSGRGWSPPACSTTPRADALEREAREAIDDAVAFAIDSPLPDPAEAWEHVLAGAATLTYAPR